MTPLTDDERAAIIARVTFIMPGLDDAGLRAVRDHAETEARLHPRDLTPGTLAAEQAARHGLLAATDDVLMRAKRERVHGADLHDTASDAAAVIGSTMCLATSSDGVRPLKCAMPSHTPDRDHIADGMAWRDGETPRPINGGGLSRRPAPRITEPADADDRGPRATWGVATLDLVHGLCMAPDGAYAPKVKP